MRERALKDSSRGRASSKSEWAGDFETTTDPEDCRVWLWGLKEVHGESFEYGTDIASFCDRLAREDMRVYFHNLAFDGKFILDYLLRFGFVHQPKGKLGKGAFKTLISKDGHFYSITVRWLTGKQCEFWDSLKKLPMSVSNIAKTFNMEINKGEIDYHLPRPKGYEPTAEEIDYLFRDVEIVARAIKVQLAAGMTRLTVGADSLAEYKNWFGAAFPKYFPILAESMDSDIRKAYRGGWTYADPRYRGRVVRDPVRVYDVNSLYPSVMYNCLLPFGEPVWCEGKPEVSTEFPLFVTALTFTATLKPGHLPCIQVKKNPFFTASEYQTEITDPITMTCTNVDLDLWMKHYDMDILSYDGAWLFRGVAGLFNHYIDKWMEVKANSTGGARVIAKLHLNSLYGKFATNLDVTPKVPVMGDDNIVHLVLGDEEKRAPVYTPMGVFITAYARDITIRAAQAHYPIFAYADTDSLHLFTDTDPEGLDVDPSKLGAWKYEGSFQAAIYVRAKCYCEQHLPGVCTCKATPHRRGCGFETHIAGLPEEIAEQIEFTDFFDGHLFEGKLVPKTVPGGVVLATTSWCLTDPALLPANA